MQCTECGIWELAPGDLVCSWCRASYLRFTLTLDPAQISRDDYPPPVRLRIRNESPLGRITVQTIRSAQPWLTPLPNQSLTPTIASGSQHIILLDADTFSVTTDTEAILTVSAEFAPVPQTVTLRLSEKTGT